MYNLKAYNKSYKYIMPEGADYLSPIPQGEEVATEELVLEVPEYIGHAFGSNTFTVQLADGKAVIYNYASFYRIEITPLEGVPEGYDEKGNKVVAEPVH